MATLQIRKETSKVWRHVPSDELPYIVSKLYIKSEGDNIRVVELGGSQRGIYNFANVSVYDIGGGAETFTSVSELMQRLEALGYVGFFYEGEVSPSTLISADLGNIIELGSDDKLYAVGGGGGGSQDLQSVTDLGSTTTNSIILTDNLGNELTLANNFLSLSSDDDFVEIYTTGLGIGNNTDTKAIALNVIDGLGIDTNGNGNTLFLKSDDIESSVTLQAPEDSGIIATRDWTDTNKQDILGFTPEDVANKENTTLDTSTTKYPTNRLVKEVTDSKVDKITTAGVERVYTINPDGSQGTKVSYNFYDLYKRHMFYYSTGATGGAPLQIGISLNESPTGTNVNGSNNVFARNIASASTAGSSGEIREATFSRVLPNKKFYFDTYISNRNASSVSTERYFYGLTSSVSAFGNIDISAISNLVSLLGIGCDTADTNIFIFQRIESGTLTKIDTGFSKTLNHNFRLTMYKTPINNRVYLTLKNITTGVTFTTDFDFANTGALNPRYHKNNGSTASAVTFGLNGFKIFIED